MRKIKIDLTLYEYDELSEEAKEKAFIEHKDFLDEIGEEYENEEGEMVKDYSEHEKEDVENSIRINEYLFYKTGEMADVVQYVGNHEKAGKIELYLKGQKYFLN